jgi:hypothetical protein
MRAIGSWRLLPLAIIAFATSSSLITMPWQATLWDGTSGYLLDLPRSPVWRAPAAPPRAAFESAHHVSLGGGKSRVRIVVEPDITDAASQAVVIVFVCCLACVPFYLALADGRRNPPLRMGAFAAGGAVVGIGICQLLWVIFGGWGPSGLTFYAACGLLVGAVAAFAKAALRPPA